MAQGANAVFGADSFYSKPYEVLERVTLNYFDPDVNSNKFYVAEIHGNAAGEYRLFNTYGRVGAAGQVFLKAYATLGAARVAFNKKVSEKERKGYVRISLAAPAVGSAENKKVIAVDALGGQQIAKAKGTKSPDKATSKGGKRGTKAKVVSDNVPPVISDFVMRIYAEANLALNRTAKGTATSSGASPLGNLGYDTIQQGKYILGRIAEVLKEPRTAVNDLLIYKYSVQYFQNIPHAMGSKITKEDILLNSNQRLSKEFDILELYADSLRLLSSMGADVSIDKQLQDLCCDFRVVSDAEWARAESLVRETAKSRQHRFGLKVTKVIGVQQHNAPVFDDSCGNVRQLFHGTRSANMIGILSSHLRLPNTLGTGVIKTGAMFGDGIYFADCSTKSANYSFGSWQGKRNKYPTAYLFLCSVALGKQKIEHDTCHYRAAPRGYNSVWGKPDGGYLKNNEFIVYRENQCKIDYIVEVEKV